MTANVVSPKKLMLMYDILPVNLLIFLFVEPHLNCFPLKCVVYNKTVKSYSFINEATEIITPHETTEIIISHETN